MSAGGAVDVSFPHRGRPRPRGHRSLLTRVRHATIGFLREFLWADAVRRRILEQTSAFNPGDIVPVPCAPDNLAMAYALKLGGTVTPLTGMFEPSVFLNGTRNTIVFERDPKLREAMFKLFATNHSPESSAACLSDLLCCLPKVEAPELRYDNLFRVLIMHFIDAHSFCCTSRASPSPP